MSDAFFRGKTRPLDAALAGLDAAVRSVINAALKDHKSDLFNEKGLEKTMEELATKQDEDPLWVIFAGDIDDFKDLNSRYPYKEVDLVLDAVGRRLEVIARDAGGTAYRRGGDEFALIVPEKAQTTVRDALVSVLKQLEVSVAGRREEIRVSFGSALHKNGTDPSDTLGRAEKASKAAKWINDRNVVGELEDAPTGWSLRRRCSGCRSQLNFSGSPECTKPGHVTCPCGASIPIGDDS